MNGFVPCCHLVITFCPALSLRTSSPWYFSGVNIMYLELYIWYMIYLLTAIGLSPGGSTHLHTNNTQNNGNNNRTTQITTNVKECGPCPVFASFTLAFALQVRKKHEKTSVRVRKTSFRVQYTYYQNTHTLQNPHKHTQTHKNTHSWAPTFSLVLLHCSTANLWYKS